MNDKAKRREIIEQYKQRDIIGGVYIIKNKQNNKCIIEMTSNLQGIINRFDFSCKTGSCVYKKLEKDWSAQKGKDFCLEVLEELKKGETQTDAEFKEDLLMLKEAWLEKLCGVELY